MKKILRKILPESFILWTHKVRAILAAYIYGFPAKKLIVIGVTGTNGKTTTVTLITKILEEAGHKVGSITTIGFSIAGKYEKNNLKMTTFPPFFAQKKLKEMLDTGCEYVVIETTSQAAIQHRLWGIPIDVEVFTNLTHDHLDYHQTFEKYKEAKGQIFASLAKEFRKPGVKKIAIINDDDPESEYFQSFPADLHLIYKINKEARTRSEIIARKIRCDVDNSRFETVTPLGSAEIKLQLPGRFNIENALAAITVGISQNVALARIKSALEKVKLIEGRMETISEGQDFACIVDYAHTPDALKKIFETVKPATIDRLISVAGATGRRDTSKRPILGALMGKYANIVIVTDEDPYDEDPGKIAEAVIEGVKRAGGKKFIEGENFFKIMDRKKAIEKAISIAKKGDTVLITGKGAEEVMAVGDKLIPFSDRKIVRDALKNLSD
jgi:UDP-N-acetylmuramoyl-L-alanyl-D-glutamate--2,6-diaminopimelate ligase